MEKIQAVSTRVRNHQFLAAFAEILVIVPDKIKNEKWVLL